MGETFKSQALEANLAQTRYKDIFIPEEYKAFIALSADYFGINKRASECITEYHHPLSNHTFVTEELRKMLLDDFWFYTREDVPADTLKLPLEMMRSLLKPEVTLKLRLNVVVTLMEFIDKEATCQKAGDSIIELTFNILEDKFESNKDLKSSAFVGSFLPLFKISCSFLFTLTLILHTAINAITANKARRPNSKIRKLLSP